MKLHHKDLLSTVLTQLWRLISGPITLILIPIYLTEEIQGYWYLFLSLSALSVFADLGFANIIMQFSAHEFAFLTFNAKGELTGVEHNLKKIGSLFQFSIKWISVVCLIVFPIMFLVGIWFFKRDGVIDQLIFSWTIYSIASLMNFFNYSLMSFIEGMNRIYTIQVYKLNISVINLTILILVLILGGNIYALALSSIISGTLLLFLLGYKFFRLFKQLFIFSKNYFYPWKKEILPLFSKYALSFASGYFIFSIFIPVMQYYKGPVEAGKVGITIALITAIFSLSNVWIYTITPEMNILVSKKKYRILNSLFKKRIFLASLTYLLISFLFVIIYVGLKNYWLFPKIFNRFLPLSGILILMICYFFQLLINSWATYIRAFKKEIYMIPSIILAVWISLATIIVAKYLAPKYFFMGFLTSYIWWLPIAYVLMQRFKIKLNDSF